MPFLRRASRCSLLRAGLLVLCVLLWSCATSDVRRADRLAEQGQWDEAVTAYREALKKSSFDPAIQMRFTQAKAQAAEHHFKAGQQALVETRLLDALRELKLALGLDPSKPEHHAAMADALRLKDARDQLQAGIKLQTLGRLDEALLAYERAVELDPTLSPALDSITAITAQQRAAKTLGGSSDPITLRFHNAKLKDVFDVLARTAGINVMFDRDVRDEPVTIYMKDLPLDDAVNLILNTHNLMALRIAPQTLLIAPNSKQKQAQYQDLLMRAFYLSNAKAKDAVNLLRTMLESKKIYVDEKVNAIVLREEPQAVVVPREAVQTTRDATFVFVRDRDYLQDKAPKIFHPRQVRVGARDDTHVEILAGALAGEVVATEGSNVLLAQLLRGNLGAACCEITVPK